MFVCVGVEGEVGEDVMIFDSRVFPDWHLQKGCG